MSTTDDDSEERIQQLESTVDRLQAENEALRGSLRWFEAGRTVGTKTLHFLAKTWFGQNVTSATRELGAALEEWDRNGGRPPLRESVNFVGAVVARLTRIGLFRVTVAALIALGTLWFSVAQVLLLSNQNRLLDSQKRSQAIDLYLRLAAEREALVRAWGAAFRSDKKLQVAIGAALKRDAPELRKVLSSPDLQRTLAADVLRTCSVTIPADWDPGELLDEATQATEAKNFDLAYQKALDLANWWNMALSRCDEQLRETNTLLEQARAEIGGATRPRERE